MAAMVRWVGGQWHTRGVRDEGEVVCGHAKTGLAGRGGAVAAEGSSSAALPNSGRRRRQRTATTEIPNKGCA